MYRIAADYLAQPLTLVYLVTLLAVANLWRRRRETRSRLLWVTIPFALLTVGFMPASCYLALGSLEWQHPPLDQLPADVEAIVVLGSGVDEPDETRREPDLDRSSLLRCLKAAAFYHQSPTPCPVLVSGGKPDPDEPGPAVADVMAHFLRRQGIRDQDLLVENQSRTTYENAVGCRELLEKHGLHRVVLVTDATHLPRALACFRKQGIDAVPCGCHYRATPSNSWRYNPVPTPHATAWLHLACHEWFGTAWYWLRGRI
jgi:uncharacterized SAM-binding protein YcdF (DUF218 family)